MRTLNLSLTTKLIMIIATAVLVPLIILAVLMTQTVRDVAFDNLESFVEENGTRRQESIENDIRAALNELNEFISSNQNLLVRPLEARLQSGLEPSVQEAAEAAVVERFQDVLLNTGYFNSVRLLTSQFFPFSTAVGENQTVSSSLQQQDLSEIGVIALNLDLDAGDTQGFAITNRDGVAHVEVINALFVENDAEESVLIGYMLADLNLNEIFVSNLQREDSAFDTYAFVVLPATNEVIAAEDILAEGLADNASDGATRAASGRIGTDTYFVGTSEARREVIGYYTPIIIDQEDFALVTEVSTTGVFSALSQRILSQAFVLVLFVTALILIASLWIANQMIVPSIRNLRRAILAVIRGNYDAPVQDVRRGDELGSLASSFVDMREYMRDVLDDINRRLVERTRDVKVTQDISRAVTAERDLTALMQQVVGLITQNFPSIYHAQIFLLDDEKKYAVLRASTGAAGRELLARGHRLAVGSVSVIGQVTEQQQVVIARDTAESDVHRANEFLGETRAELAIPLRLGNTLIGALDVQSKEHDSFDANQVAALQTLADQITIAIENTRLYAERERLLQEAESERGRSTYKAWQQYLYQQRESDLKVRTGTQTSTKFEQLTQAVYMNGKAVVGEVTSRETIPFAVPIRLRGQILGVVEYEVPKVSFSYDKVLLAEELVSRLAISLENARLFQTSQQATKREQVVNEISAKLTNQSSVEDILQTAVREVERALRTPQVAIRLNDLSMNGHHSNGNGVKAQDNGSHAEKTTL